MFAEGNIIIANWERSLSYEKKEFCEKPVSCQFWGITLCVSVS